MHIQPPTDSHKEHAKNPPPSCNAGRRPYHRPRLTCFGDVRDLTLGASGNNPESGGNFFPFP